MSDDGDSRCQRSAGADRRGRANRGRAQEARNPGGVLTLRGRGARAGEVEESAGYVSKDGGVFGQNGQVGRLDRGFAMSVAGLQYDKFKRQVVQDRKVFTFTTDGEYLVFRVHDHDVIPFWS